MPVRLALGGVQFGLPYGITHVGGAVPEAELAALLAEAAAAGVTLIDTAAAYGESEAAIGRLPAAAAFDVVTKTLPGDAAHGFARSLALLRRDRVAALLVHDAAELLDAGGPALWAVLAAARASSAAGRIGVSVYDGETLAAVLARFPVEVVQLPLNAFDQRLLRDGTLQRLADAGIEVHVRSSYLQGLLVAGPEVALPAALAGARPALRRWYAAVAAAGTTPEAAALGFVAACPGVTRIVVGLHDRAQLRHCLDAMRRPAQLPWAEFASADAVLCDPRRWREGAA